MRWKNLSLAKKMGVGFGSVVVLLVIIGGSSIYGIGGIVDNASEVIEGNKLNGMMAEKEVDHLNWARQVSALLTDDTVTELAVQTDDHKCGFGKWLYGDERKKAEADIPSIAPMLKEIEKHHLDLHASAVDIGNNFQQANVFLPGVLCAREVDHLEWAAEVESLFLHNLPELHVQTDHTQCGFGQWLNGSEAQELAAQDPDFAALLEKVKEPHQRLHDSAIAIQQVWKQRHPGLRNTLTARLDDHRQWADKVCRACITANADFDVQTDAGKCKFGEFLANDQCKQWCSDFPELASALDACRAPHDKLHESAIRIKEAFAAGEKEKGRKIYETETGPALDEIATNFYAAIAAETALVEAQEKAREIFDTQSLPALEETRGNLYACRQYAQHSVEGMNEANHIFATRTEPALHEVQGLLGQIRDEVRANVMTDEAMLASAANTRNVVITLSAIAVVLGIVLALIIARGIIRPILKSVGLAEAVADGDLTQQVDINQKDEIGVLANALNRMSKSLQEIMGSIAENARTLAGSATELSSTATQLASGAEETTNQSATVASAAEEMSSNMSNMAASSEEMSANVKTVAAAVEEMTSSISEVARNAEEAASVAAEASRLAEQSNADIGQLDAAAGEIGKVIEVIQDIAEQTNLLALNATIEAARAGEAGKGFAVVATEVKELAKQTADATEGIRQRVEAIQGSTGTTVQAIGNIGEVIAKVTSVSRTIASAVEEQSATTREISQNVAQTASAAEVVATGVTESASATQEITQNIVGVDQAAREAAQGANQTQIAGQELSKLSEQLSGMVSKFKIS